MHKPMPPAPVISEKDASHYLGMSRSFLRIARMRGRGPAYLRLGRTIRYAIVDLDAWLASRRVRTDDAAV